MVHESPYMDQEEAEMMTVIGKNAPWWYYVNGFYTAGGTN